MKPFSPIACVAALSAAVFLAMVRAEAHTAPPPAQPSERERAGRIEAAQELFALISKETNKELVSHVIGQVWPPVEAALSAKNPTIDAATRGGLRAEMERIFGEFLADILKGTPPIYARYFTDEELRGLMAFYRTPLGAKAMQAMPQITAETMAMLTPRMKDVVTQTNQAFTQILRQRGYSL